MPRRYFFLTLTYVPTVNDPGSIVTAAVGGPSPASALRARLPPFVLLIFDISLKFCGSFYLF